MAEPKIVRLVVVRQDAPEKAESRRKEAFEIPREPGMTVHGALERIRKRPVTVDDKTVSPPVWESSCLEGACGACTMLVNGRVAQACTTRVSDVSPKGQPIVLEPLRKFPLERDLVVDRSRMFESLVHVKAWVALDGAQGRGAGPTESPEAQATRYSLSRCTTCGACLEACPEYRESAAFVGAAAINQARLFNLHPSGAHQATERTEALMGEGGVADCGKAQNCVEVCPQDIPLVDSIGEMSRATTKRLLFGWLLK